MEKYKPDSTQIITGEKESFEGAIKTLLRDGDILSLYFNLKGPSFNQEDFAKRNLKYNIFVGRGKEYVSEKVFVPRLLLGAEVLMERKGEGNLISLLKEKEEVTNKLYDAHKKSYEKLINTAREYINKLKSVNERYRQALKEKLEGRDMPAEKRNEKIRVAKKYRKEIIDEQKKEFNEKMNKFIEELNSHLYLKEEDKKAYEFLIKYSHFIFYDSVIVGSGENADLKIGEPWISEHQGLIYREEWDTDNINEICYENIGLCDATIIKFFKDKKLESIVNKESENKLIDFNDPRGQKVFLFLSQTGEGLKPYEEFLTTPVYICFELPAAS